MIVVGAFVCVAAVSALILAHFIREGEKQPPSPRSGDELVTDAPSRVAGRARSLEQSRRSGFDDTRAAQEPPPTGRSAGPPELEVSVTDSEFVVEATDELPPGAWARLEVDRDAGRVTTTCGGPPTVWCKGGRWSVTDYATTESYLLGR